MDKFRVENKVAVVTGASSGIGRATAMALAERGAQLALIDINASGLQNVAETIGCKECLCKYYISDVANYQDLEATFKEIMKEFGRIDILVNVAGIWESVPFLEMSSDHFERMLDVNLKGAFNSFKLSLPTMVKRRYGKIVSVSSLAGKQGSMSGGSHYAASKGGLIALSASLAREFGSNGININVVCPGLIETPLLGPNGPSEKGRTGYTSQSAQKRPGQPEEVAALIVFLASDAASHVTGQAWNICGGSRID